MDLSTASTYRTQPVHIFPDFTIAEGHIALAHLLSQAASNLSGPKIIVIDGFVGLPWPAFIDALRVAMDDQQVRWLSTETCFRSSDEIDTLLATFLTEDPVFGRLFHGTLPELWTPEKVASLKENISHSAATCLTVLYGFGASLLTSAGVQVYVDVPKDRGQQLGEQKAVANVGAREPASFKAMYKRLFFVDWPMLNQIKRDQLARLDFFVDGTDAARPLIVTGADLLHTLHALAHQPFRVKPWFAAGPWGGQWMKEQFALPADQPNYAWSFETIAPENGILLGNQEQRIECSFDYLLWAETDAVLGIPVSARYGSYFPIRFDYLDTMGGTNLSCQVHPRVDYMRNTFGEPFTQDETYYIVANKPGSRVYLGLHEDTDIAAFRADATAARDHDLPFDINKHVHSQSSQAHDLFLIPSGTVHCSGENNLVLEISATPYIYTFKIYDYLRKDLKGNRRHVHLDHAFANLESSRRTDWVTSNLCPQPVLLREETGGKEYVIGDIEQLFFAIHRFEFTDTITDHTNGKFQVLNLVEGERCEVISAHAAPFELRFAESLIIPASLGYYQLHNLGQSQCKVVKSFVKG